MFHRINKFMQMIWTSGYDCYWIQYNSPKITLLKNSCKVNLEKWKRLTFLKQLTFNINAFQNTKK